jgi:hypothetical protein
MADDTLDPTDDLVALFSQPTEPVTFRAQAPQKEGLHKRCARCGQLRPRTSFTRDRKNSDGLYPWCVGCKNGVRAERYANNHTLKKRLAAKHRERTYGMTRKHYEALRAAQEGRCALCQEELVPGKQTHVDHCHATGKVRALLCNSCNRVVGVVEKTDDVRLIVARAYIESYKG